MDYSNPGYYPEYIPDTTQPRHGGGLHPDASGGLSSSSNLGTATGSAGYSHGSLDPQVYQPSASASASWTDLHERDAQFQRATYLESGGYNPTAQDYNGGHQMPVNNQYPSSQGPEYSQSSSSLVPSSEGYRNDPSSVAPNFKKRRLDAISSSVSQAQNLLDEAPTPMVEFARPGFVGGPTSLNQGGSSPQHIQVIYDIFSSQNVPGSDSNIQMNAGLQPAFTGNPGLTGQPQPNLPHSTAPRPPAMPGPSSNSSIQGNASDSWGPQGPPNQVPVAPRHVPAIVTAAPETSTESLYDLGFLHSRKLSPLYRIYQPDRNYQNISYWKHDLFRRVTSPSNASINCVFFPRHSNAGPSPLNNQGRTFLRWSLTWVGNYYHHNTESFKGLIKEHTAFRYTKLPTLRNHLLNMAIYDNACHLNVDEDLKDIRGNKRFKDYLVQARKGKPLQIGATLVEKVVGYFSDKLKPGQPRPKAPPPGFKTDPDWDHIKQLLINAGCDPRALQDDAWAGLASPAPLLPRFHYASRDLLAVMKGVASFFNDTQVVSNADAGWAGSGLAGYAAAVMQLSFLLIIMGYLTPSGLVGLTEEDEDHFAEVLDHQTSWRRILIRWLEKVSVEEGTAPVAWSEVDADINKAIKFFYDNFNQESFGQPLSQRSIIACIMELLNPQPRVGSQVPASHPSQYASSA